MNRRGAPPPCGRIVSQPSGLNRSRGFPSSTTSSPLGFGTPLLRPPAPRQRALCVRLQRREEGADSCWICHRRATRHQRERSATLPCPFSVYEMVLTASGVPARLFGINFSPE